MPIKSSISLVKRAKEKIKTLNFEEAFKLHNYSKTLFIDVRDIRELEKTGKILNAKHAPRGMLEFWIDPESPYHKTYFNLSNNYIFYCASGWRSALASQTAIEMGLPNVYSLNKGITEWISFGGPIEKVLRKNNFD